MNDGISGAPKQCVCGLVPVAQTSPAPSNAVLWPDGTPMTNPDGTYVIWPES